MSEIIGFLTAYWLYILAYPFVGFTLARLKWKIFGDKRPTSKLKNSEKVIRCLFFPISGYNDENWKTRQAGKEFRGLFEDVGKETYTNCLIFFWPFALLPSLLGFVGFAFLATVNSACFLGTLPEKSYLLLQSGSRRLKLLAPGKNQDIKTIIGQIEEFKSTRLEPEKNKILAEQKATEDRSRVIEGNLESWQIVVRKNANTTAKISPILESLVKERDSLASKKSNLCQLEEKLNVAEKSLSESVEVLWRCLSTIPLGIPVYTDGPQLIKGDYVATLASDTISQAEAEMARIKDEINKFGNGGG